MRELYIKTEGTEPVTQSELTAYLNYGGTDAGTLSLITELATAARLKLENFTGRNFTEKTMVLNTDDVKTTVVLPQAPINEIVSIKVYDEDGVLDETLTAGTDYYLLGDFDKWIRLESFFTGGYLSIEYTAGYGDNTFDLPDTLKSAIMRQTKYDYDYRGSVEIAAIVPEVQKLLIAYQCSFL
jgi:uncharacterized phiE125 gp8 family phage protein